MPKKPIFTLPRLVARALTYLLIFTSFWYFDAFLGAMNSVAEAQAKPPAPGMITPPTVFRVPQSTLPVDLVKISTGFNGLIGVDYHAASDQLLVSVNYNAGEPHNFELIDHDGNHRPYTTVHGLTDEVYIATARDTLGGFAVGDTFTGNGKPGEIMRMSPDGQIVTNPWVKLPNEQGLLRGGLHVDQTGIWNGDLIVVTTSGGVWRVNSRGEPQILAHLNDLVEGPTTVPNDPVRYGPWAGTILAGAEGSGKMYSITTQGVVRSDSLGISIEGAHVIPPKQNFYASCYGAGTLVGASAASLTPYVGDILVPEEFAPNIWVVRWDGTAFQKTLIAQGPAGFEGSAFSPTGIVELPPISPPPTLTLTPPQTIQATGPDGATAGIIAMTTSEACTVLRLTWSVDGLPVERIDTFPASGSPPSAGSASQSRPYAPGAHTITVSATDSIQQTTTAQTTVTVIAQPPVKTLTSIDVTPATSQLNIGQTETLTATGHYSDGSTADVTALAGWSSQDANVATAAPGGVVKGLSPGAATVAANLDGKTGTATVTVVKNLIAITVAPVSSQITVGQTVQLTATGHYDDGSSTDITSIAVWSSNAANSVTVNATGLATGAAVGTAIVTASLVGLSGSASVSVNRILVSIAVTPGNPSIPVAGTQPFVATGTYNDGSTANLTLTSVWSSGTPSIATITGTGLATSLAAGTTTITATQAGISGSTTLTVVSNPAPTVSCTIARPELWPPDHDLIDVGLTVTVNTPGDPNPQVTVKVYSDEPEESQTGDGKFSPDARQYGVAAPGPIPLLIRAERKGNGEGRVYLVLITVTTASGQTATHCCTVVVPKSQSKNDLDAVHAVAAQAEASCGPNGSPVTPILVGIGPNIGPKQGPSLAAITLTPTPGHVGKGSQKQFTAKGWSGAGGQVNLIGDTTWTSGAPTISSVNGSGIAKGLNTGTSTIGATNGGVSGFATLDVGSVEPTSLVVYPAIASLFEKSSWNYSVLAHYADGSSQDVTAQATLTSSDPAKATVDSAGLVKTISGGSATITASLNGLTATGALSVLPVTATELILFIPRTTLVVGQQEQPSIKAHMNNCTVKDINGQALWTSSNPAVAGVYNGVGYIISLTPGTTTITVSFGTLVTSQLLTVVPRRVTSLGIAPQNLTFRVGQPIQYAVGAGYNDGTGGALPNTDVTWTTSGASATITPNAVLTASEPGQLYVRATLISDPTVTTFTLATVVPIQLTNIIITPGHYTQVTAGRTQQFAATGFYSDGTSKNITAQVTWSVYDPRIAQISTTGLFTVYAAGSNYVYASLNGFTQYAFIIQNAAELTAVTVEPSSAQLITGQLGQYAAVGHYTDGSTQIFTSTATWSSSDAGVATVNTAGVVTAFAPGTATITAAQGGFSGTSTLTVVAPTVVSIAFPQTNPQITVGHTFQLQAIASLNDGNTQNVTSQATWTSSNAAVATVSATGLVTAVGAGQASITATLGGNTFATLITVTAQTRTMTSLSMTPGASQRVVGQTIQYAVIAGYNDGTSDDVTATSTWSSLAPAVATVSATGLAVGVGVGTTQIQATFNGVAVGQNLQVIAAPKTLSSVAVLPGSATLSGGQSGQFLAVATYSDGSKLDVTTQSAWGSSNQVVATVGASTGIAKALTAGSTTITATFGGKTGFATLSVTVQTKTLTSIALFPSNPSLPATQTGQFQAVGTYSDGSQQDVTLTSTWASSAPSVATVSVSGLVTGLTIGVTTVTASIGTKSGATTVNVVASNPPPTASIPGPAIDSTVTMPVKLTGTASGANFASYVLEYTQDGTTYTRFGGGTTSVVNGELGTFDPTVLQNGVYTVRLTVNDTTGQSTSETTQYIVSGGAKIGLFSLTFTDLNIPVSGVPVMVNRTYDSRNRGQGDFGNGWNLDLRTLKLTQNKEPGRDGWEAVSLQGGIFPGFQLVSNKAHYVTVTLPNGRTETFDWTPSNEVLYSDVIVPAPTLVGRPGTTSTLTALGDQECFVVGENLEDFSFQLFKPVNFRLTTKDGTQYLFNVNAGLLQVKDSNGNALNISSTGLSSSTGVSVTLTRDALNRITKITDPLGQSLRYQYDGAGNLISVTDRAGNATTFTYTPENYLKDIFDPLGRRPIRNEYDDSGRLISSTDANGKQVLYSHDVDTRQEIVTDRNNNQTVYEYDARGNVTKVTDPQGGIRSSTYDAKDNVLTRTDSLGITTTLSYDSLGNQLSSSVVVDGSAVVTSFTYNSFGRVLTATDPRGKGTTNTYDAKGNLLTTTDPLSHVTTNTYDLAGRMSTTTDAAGTRTEFGYDGGGRVNDQRIYSGATLIRRISSTCDSNGRPIQQVFWGTDSGGNFSPVAVTATTYDPNGQVLQTTDALGKSTFTTYNGAGQRSSTTDKNGNTTVYQYNSLGLLESTQYPSIRIGQNVVTPTETLGYDANGNRTSFKDRNGNVNTTEYDTLNRPVKFFNPDGTFRKTTYDAASRTATMTNELGKTTTFGYDGLGRRTSVTDPLGKVTLTVYDAAGRRTSTMDALNHQTQFEYDDADRQTKVIFDGGTFRATGYDEVGRRTSETDEAGVKTSYLYAPTGELLEVQQPDAANPAAQTTVTKFTYDRMGRKTSQIDALGRVTLFTYTLRGELASRKRPMGQTESYSYDSQGNLTTRTDAIGQTVLYQYNSLNQLAAKLFPDGSSHVVTYFPGGQRASATVSNAFGIAIASTFGLDDHNRLISQAESDGTVVQWAYDAAGNRTRVKTPSLTVDYTFTDRNEMSQVFRNGSSTPWATYTYDDVGNRASLAYVNGTRADYAYNNKNQLLSIHNVTATSTISSYTYTLDPRGMRSGVTEDTGRAVSYTYDGLKRLTKETITESNAQTEIAYTLDAVGNRLQKAVTAGSSPIRTTNYTYDLNDELLTELGPDGLIQHTYDANGQMTTKTAAFASVSYTWNVDGRLSRATSPGQALEFTYDVDGIRTSKTVNATQTSFVVDKNRDYAQVVEERDEAGTSRAAYVYGDDLLSQERSTEVNFYHTDGQLSIRQLTDGAANTTDTYSYDAFGVVVSSTGSTLNPYRYGGQQNDPDLGYYFLRARYLATSTGRFLSADSFPGDDALPSSLHRYLYTEADPVNHSDPSGLESLAEINIANLGQATIRSSATVSNTFTAARLSASVAVLLMGTAASLVLLQYSLTRYVAIIQDQVQRIRQLTQTFNIPQNEIDFEVDTSLLIRIQRARKNGTVDIAEPILNILRDTVSSSGFLFISPQAKAEFTVDPSLTPPTPGDILGELRMMDSDSHTRPSYYTHLLRVLPNLGPGDGPVAASAMATRRILLHWDTAFIATAAIVAPDLMQIPIGPVPP